MFVKKYFPNDKLAADFHNATSVASQDE